MPTVEQENEVDHARALQRRRERAQMFREVFGTEDQPTKHGKFILDALRVSFDIRGIPRNMLDVHGRTDMWQTARRLGHYDVIESIYEAIRWKEHEHPSSSGLK